MKNEHLDLHTSMPPVPSGLDGKLLTYSPERLAEFLQGHISLGELEGIGKEAQYDMAESGFRCLNEGRLEDAKQVFDGLVALDPYDAYFHAALGSIAQRQDALEEADKKYTRALEINPHFPTALANRGEVRLSLGRMEEGVTDLLSALDADPEAREAATHRACILLKVIHLEAQSDQEA